MQKSLAKHLEIHNVFTMIMVIVLITTHIYISE